MTTDGILINCLKGLFIYTIDGTRFFTAFYFNLKLLNLINLIIKIIVHYSEEEAIALMKIIDELVPIEGKEWDIVQRKHLEAYAHMDRTVGLIERKYNLLAKTKMPTGDPHCPEEVRLAKRIKVKIYKQADVSDYTERFDVSSSGYEERNESDEISKERDTYSVIHELPLFPEAFVFNNIEENNDNIITQTNLTETNGDN